jgi:hypothetical protein
MIGSPARLPVAYAVLAESDWRRSTHLIRETGPTEPPKPRLLDRVRGAIRARHMSRSTEESYVGGIRRFILFHVSAIPPRSGHPSDALAHGAGGPREGCRLHQEPSPGGPDAPVRTRRAIAAGPESHWSVHRPGGGPVPAPSRTREQALTRRSTAAGPADRLTRPATFGYSAFLPNSSWTARMAALGNFEWEGYTCTRVSVSQRR